MLTFQKGTTLILLFFFSSMTANAQYEEYEFPFNARYFQNLHQTVKTVKILFCGCDTIEHCNLKCVSHYNLGNKVSEEVFKSGTSNIIERKQFMFDGKGRIERETAVNSKGDTIRVKDFFYDDYNNLKSIHCNNFVDNKQFTWSYVYDNKGRIIEQIKTTNQVYIDEKIVCEFDGSNRIAKSLHYINPSNNNLLIINDSINIRMGKNTFSAIELESSSTIYYDNNDNIIKWINISTMNEILEFHYTYVYDNNKRILRITERSTLPGNCVYRFEYK